jgi:hypothetical protein
MFTVAVLTAAGAAVAWSMLHQTPDGRILAEGLAAFAALLLVWGLFSGSVDRSRRVKLDRAVDEEMGKKWGPGFARTVGVYEKPWYLLCGETGVGKTAALRAGRLPMAIGPDGQPVTDASQGMNGTFMFDWWFFDDAVVLDSAGDLIANPDERWSAFLDRIRDARPARPINGMILSVSAEDLLGDVETVREKAVLLARQVEVARQRLHVRFPLYLLVTKSDLITGFSDYFPAGSDLKSSFQILGWSNPQDPRRDDGATPPSAVRAGLEGVVTDLRRRRSLSMARTTTARTDADHRIDHLDEMFAFPAAVAACLDNIEEFTAKLLAGSGTVAPPFLRGVYFTSALRTGDALDVELRNAFGVEQLPAGRRKPSDRAFFLRDLLLEKIVPEAGMVAPLQDVVTANSRRTRTVIGVSAMAALAVIAVTALGFRKTVGRVENDRNFWKTIETKDGAPMALQVFGPDGSWHGGDKLPSGQTVLATQMQAAELSGSVVASSLLPLSAELDHDRKEAHADLFRETVLVPSLTPAPPAADAPPDRVAVITKLLTDTQTPDPIPVQKLRDDAKTLVETGTSSAADRPKLLELIKTGVPARDDSGNPAAAVRLTNADRARIATACAAWVEKYTANRKEAVRVQLAQGRITLEQAHKLEMIDRRFGTAFGPDGTAAEQAAVVAELNAPIPAVNLSPVSTKPLEDSPELLELSEVVGSQKLTETGERMVAAAKVDRNNLADIRNQWYDAATGLPASSRQDNVKAADLATEINRINRDDLAPVDGKPAGKPAVVARLDRDRDVLATAAALADVKSRFDKIASPYPHPYFRLPAVLAGIDADIAQQVKPIGNGNDPASEAARRILKDAGQTARDGAWKHVIEFNGAGLGDVLVEGGATRRIDGTPTAIEANDLFLHVRVDAQAAPWLRAVLATNIAVRDAALPADPATRDAAGNYRYAIAAAFSKLAKEDLASWTACVAKQQKPDVQNWKLLQARLGANPDYATLAARLDTALAPDREAFGIFASAKQFPELAKDAAAQLDGLAPPVGAALDRDKAIVDFLNTAGFASAPAAEVRRRLLANPAATDRQITAATLSPSPARTTGVDPTPATASTSRFEPLLDRSIDLLVEDQRPKIADALSRIHDTAADTYPLVATGKKSWPGDTKTFRADLDLIAANGSSKVTTPLALRIRDLDVVTADWAEYLNYLNLLCDKLDKPITGSIKFEKEGGHGNWSYVAIAAVGKPMGRPFMYDRAMKPTPIDDVDELRKGLAVSLLSSPDRPTVVAEIVDTDQISRPWSLIRLAAQKQPVRLNVKSDEVTDKFYGVLVTTKLDGFDNLAVPSAVPDVAASSGEGRKSP